MTENNVPALTSDSELMEAAAVLISKSNKYTTVPSDADAEVLSEFRARVNKASKDLDAERLDMTAGARETISKINAKYNAKITELEGIVKQSDTLLKEFFAAKQRERERLIALADAERKRVEEEQRKADADAEAARQLAAEATTDAERQAAVDLQREADARAREIEVVAEAQASLPMPASVSTTLRGSRGSSSGLRDNWKYRVTDISKVPEAYLVSPEDRVQRSVLNALARSQKGKASVPGVEFYNDQIIGSRTAS